MFKKIKPVTKKNYINLENKETIDNKIYNSRKNKMEILEDNGTFIFYKIDKINSKLPSINDDKFTKQIKLPSILKGFLIGKLFWAQEVVINLLI